MKTISDDAEGKEEGFFVMCKKPFFILLAPDSA